MSTESTERIDPQIAIVSRLRSDENGEAIEVWVSYEIIKLFSEGLYQSPHKAIEELVTNSFDADANRVFVLIPRTGDDAPVEKDSLWVIDDGTGMDSDGLHNLWRVADSQKYDSEATAKGRWAIGQFGIGKLAAYVLAWRLTHISKTNDSYFYTSMDYHKVSEHHQFEGTAKPLAVALHQIEEEEAKALLGEIESRDPTAWSTMFGPKAAESWTAAALSDFKDLFGKLQGGRLAWVLRTGLPLNSDFSIYLNGEQLKPAIAEAALIAEFPVGGPDDAEAQQLGLECTDDGVTIPGIEGVVTGRARVFERRLAGKMDAMGRSRGFFVRVRTRVINLDDELFGIEPLNHAAWAHFALEIDADGLRDHLLSSREGVRGSEAIENFREYLHEKFNACRRAYDRWVNTTLIGLDISKLLVEAPSPLVLEPLTEAVRSEMQGAGGELYYIKVPRLEGDEQTSWLDEFDSSVADKPFASMEVKPGTPYEALTEYDASSRNLLINQDHPFISKMLAHSRNQTPITLFSSSEIITEALLRHVGIESQTAIEFFELRDRVLRVLAGEYPPDAFEVLRLLEVANQSDEAMEIAVGQAFVVLGLDYEKRGGNKGGPDGVLKATLGRQGTEQADYKIVYDAKTTVQAAVPAEKVDLAAVSNFKRDEQANFAFVIAKEFDGQTNADGALNRRVRQQAGNGQPVSMIVTNDLRRIVSLHYHHGVTLTRLRSLFENAQTTVETRAWVDTLEAELGDPDAQVPLKRLLDGLERAKQDQKSMPNINAVRALDDKLTSFEPARLAALLAALQTIVGSHWIHVNKRTLDVALHQTSQQIIIEMERRLKSDGATDASN